MTTKKMPDTGNNRGPEPPATEEVAPGNVWSCKIGWGHAVPQGGDLPMRKAIAAAFLELTGLECDFIFSGWGGELTEGELAVVENREPKPPSPPRSAGRVWTLVHRSLSLGMVTEHFWNVEGEKPEKDAEPIRVVPEEDYLRALARIKELEDAR